MISDIKISALIITKVLNTFDKISNVSEKNITIIAMTLRHAIWLKFSNFNV